MFRTYCIKLPISFCLQRRGPGNSFVFFHSVVTQDQINSILIKEGLQNLVHVSNTEADFYFNPTNFYYFNIENEGESDSDKGDHS